jgi:hypothetical protein
MVTRPALTICLLSLIVALTFALSLPASATSNRAPLATPSETVKEQTTEDVPETPKGILGEEPPPTLGKPIPGGNENQIRDTDAGAPVGEITIKHKLTEESITKYYNASKIVHGRPYDMYEDFYFHHIKTDADITWNLVTHAPGQKVKRETFEMGKDDFIAGLKKTFNESQGADITHKVTSLRVAPDGQTAKAQQITILSNILEIPKNDDTRKKLKLHLQLQSYCNDDFVIAIGAIPQIKKSVCQIEKYYFVKPPTKNPI